MFSGYESSEWYLAGDRSQLHKSSIKKVGKKNVDKERRMTKRTNIRRVMIRDNKSFCQIILQNLIKIYTEVYKLYKYMCGQRSCKIRLSRSMVMF